MLKWLNSLKVTEKLTKQEEQLCQLQQRLREFEKEERRKNDFSGSALVVDTKVFQELIEKNVTLQSTVEALGQRMGVYEKAISGIRNSMKNTVHYSAMDEKRGEINQVPSKKDALDAAKELTNATYPNREEGDRG